MSLPTLTKTWQISANNSYPAQGSTFLAYRNFFYNFVTWLKNNGWTVKAASNTSTASISTDWTSAGSLTWFNSGAHSWIILKNSSISTNFDFCIDLTYDGGFGGGPNGLPGGFKMFVSPGGYNVGGVLSTSSRPSTTNSDEVQLIHTGVWTGGGNGFWGNSDSAITWHGWSSTDRECTRAMIYAGENLVGIIMLDRIQNPTAGWNYPYYAICRSYALQGGVITTQTAHTTAIMRTTFGTNATTDLFISSDTYASTGTYNNSPNEISREYLISPLGLVYATSPYRGHHGYMADAWWTAQTKNGTLLPNVATKSFSLHGGMVLPWDGTSFVKTK